MQIETVKFGKVTIEDDAVIQFKDGLPGFSRLKRFCLVESLHDHLFMWLQSVDDPKVAFPVIEPQFCAPAYKCPISERDALLIGIQNISQVKILCIVTIPEDPREMTANLRAPIVISLASHQATQLISPDSSYPVRHPIFNDLQRFVAVQGGKGSDDALGQTPEEPRFQIHRFKESGA